jgi:sigma-E factor negative regulatory protein RseC
VIEEQGRVVAIEPGAVWVETMRKSTCSSCSANAGCGQGLMDRLNIDSRRGYVRALCDLHLQVGDGVVIGVREDLLVRSSLLVYVLPLLGLFAAAMLAEHFALRESLIVLAGLCGFASAWLLVRWRSMRTADDPALQPIVLRALLGGARSPG